MKINTKIKLGSFVKNKLDDTELYVDKVTIDSGGGVEYGCKNGNGEYRWLRDREIQESTSNRIGYKLEVQC